MHLDLIDRPFVPHNPISAQESPIPLPKFQMAPRLKILMSSGSKKGNQLYYPFLSKVPASESPPGSPVGSLWRDIPACRALLHLAEYISFYLSVESPVREPPPCSLTWSPWTGILHHQSHWSIYSFINLLKPNDIHICRTAALTSRCYILNIYSTNIHTEYFKHAE